MTTEQDFKITRLAPRYKFKSRESCESKIIDKNNYSESVISTVDLSPSGVAFLKPPTSNSTNALKTGDTILIELSPFGSQPIRCFAKIIRTQPVAGTTLYGAQFVALPLLHQERLDKMIRTAHMNTDLQTMSDARDLGFRLSPKRLLKRLMLFFSILTLIYAQVRVIEYIEARDTRTTQTSE